MQYMNTVFYNMGPQERVVKRQDRISYDSALLPNLKIMPMNQARAFSLYYIPTMRTLDLIGHISRSDIVLDEFYKKLPAVAQKNFFVDILSDELYNTNTIEGIESSKEELVSTTREVLSQSTKGPHKKASKQFSNFINSYYLLSRGDLKMVSDANDVRKLYDEVTLDGVAEKDLPDGTLFRKGDVFVYRAGKEIHRGLSSAVDTEKEIVFALSNLISFVQMNKEVHPLIKNAIFHYYFAYIHPFYDGNGRTNRFISSLYLMEDFSMLTALSLSQGCNSERNLYLRAFDFSNQVSMQGELNFFVDSFLHLLHRGQESLIESLQIKANLLDAALEKIQKDPRLDADLRLMMEALSQVYLFGFKGSLSVKDFEALTGYKEQTVRNKLNHLEDLGLVVKLSRNPFLLVINRAYLEE